VPQQSKRRRSKDQKDQKAKTGDLLWTVDSPGEGVIDAPAQPTPTEPGPALGRGH
jgi:hypothetical protein